jgi:hypothetical protein
MRGTKSGEGEEQYSRRRRGEKPELEKNRQDVDERDTVGRR